MRRRRFLTGSSMLAAAGFAPSLALACRFFPADVTDRYVAWQAQRAVGRQVITFTREPGRFLVDVRTGMRFTVPGIGEISYEHESRETWNTGWLHALDSRTLIDGRVQEVHAERRGASLMVEGTDIRRFQISTYVVPSSLWHRDSRLVEAFIDVERGNILSVRPRYLGKETLEQGGGVVEAHRYALRGQIDREAWYDSDCVLVRWDLPVAGGDWISFRRETA